MSQVESVPIRGFYSLVHKGVRPAIENVNQDLYRGFFGHEADRQAELPNTAIVKSGPIEIIKAPHGLRREIFITDVHIAGYTEHSYTTGPFGTVHHWDCTVSVSYSGIGYYIPEGAILEIFTVNVTAQALRDELRRVSGR